MLFTKFLSIHYSFSIVCNLIVDRSLDPKTIPFRSLGSDALQNYAALLNKYVI